MGTSSQSGVSEYRLESPGHPCGVSCDENGPALGPIRLLAKTGNGFKLRPIDELEGVLEETFARSFDYRGLLDGLRVVVRALNDGDSARAITRKSLLNIAGFRKALLSG